MTIVVSLRDGFHIYLKNAQRNVCRKNLPISVGAGVPDRPAVVCFLFRERQANSEGCTWLSLWESWHGICRD